MKRPAWLFVLLCSGCILTTLVFGVHLIRKSSSTPTPRPASAAPPSAAPASAAPQGVLPSTPVRSATPVKPQPAFLSAVPTPVHPAAPRARQAENLPGQKVLFFRANALGENYGKLGFAPLDSLRQFTYAPALSCDRVHFAAGTGICLVADRGLFTKYYAVSFGKDLKAGWQIPLNGIPSRTRVSPSGRLAAITIFLSGHSYASLNFSTQTLIVDSANGRVLADLEKFAVQRDGVPFESPDFNFWGVTFAHNENQFYATLWSKGKTYLVKCDLRARSAVIIYEGVECPSVSPDNTRIAFKKRSESSRLGWRIHVLDLKTMIASPTGETHSVDDQVEWLDDSHLLYSRSQSETGSSASTDLWDVPTAPGGTPELLLEGAFSPAVAWLN
jgi:hypothetical protein